MGTVDAAITCCELCLVREPRGLLRHRRLPPHGHGRRRRPDVLISRNTGSTWERTVVPALEQFNSASVTCGSSTSCVVTVFATDSGALTHLWLTTTSGTTWSAGAILLRGPDNPLALQCASGRVHCIGCRRRCDQLRRDDTLIEHAVVSDHRLDRLPRVAECATTTLCFAAGNVLVPWGGAVVDEVTVRPLRLVTVPLPATSGIPTPVAISCTATYCVLVGALYTVRNGQATSLAPHAARWSHEVGPRNSPPGTHRPRRAPPAGQQHFLARIARSVDDNARTVTAHPRDQERDPTHDRQLATADDDPANGDGDDAGDQAPEQPVADHRRDDEG